MRDEDSLLRGRGVEKREEKGRWMKWFKMFLVLRLPLSRLKFNLMYNTS